MKLELPAVKKQVFETLIPMRWGDMDAMGHVNNTLYFRYLEIARTDWLQHIGSPPSPAGEGPVIVNAFCNFHKQLEYPGVVRATQYVSDPGRSSFETWCVLTLEGDPHTVYASGGATVVWVNFPQQKSVPLPDWLRAQLF